jgi:hypothetical protein
MTASTSRKAMRFKVTIRHGTGVPRHIIVSISPDVRTAPGPRRRGDPRGLLADTFGFRSRGHVCDD